MQTPIDFGKDFLNRFFDLKDADACLKMLAGDLVWITPEDMHHFLSEGAVLRFLQKSIAEDTESRYVDLISIKSSPSADNIMTVAYEVNLVSREDERPLYLRCSMAICRRSRRLEITFLHFSRKTAPDSSEQLRGFISNLPCGVMILACLDGQREEVIFYNDYFERRLRYSQADFARAMEQNPFFMTSEEDRDRVRDQIGQARKNGGNISANLRFFRRDGNSFYYRMLGAPAYQADGGTVYYCVFQEITGFQMTNDRLQDRLDLANGILRQIPEAICGIEYPPEEAEAKDVRIAAAGEGGEEKDVRVYRKKGGKGRPRVFFTSKNIPALFGVSNSAYMKNILLDPFYGLEITSITREKLMASQVFGGTGAAPRGPVSCGIFRMKRHTGTAETAPQAVDSPRTAEIAPSESSVESGGYSAVHADSADSAVNAANPVPSLRESGEEKGEGRGRRSHARTDREPPRVELVVRRVREKSGMVRLYLFYYDREAQQQEMERRIDRAMKMGRAGQDQLRADLRKAKETASRRKSEMGAALQAAQEKHDVEVTRVENRLLEEKNRAVLLARQLEESRSAQKQMAGELEQLREETSRSVRSSRETAEKQVREAVAARDLLEEQLREAQERSRMLERQLQSERTRRVLLEEQIREGRSVSSLLDGNAGKTAEQVTPAVSPVDPAEDWMNATRSLTVFSSIDPVPAGKAPMAIPGSSVSYGGSAGGAGVLRTSGITVPPRAPVSRPASMEKTRTGLSGKEEPAGTSAAAASAAGGVGEAEAAAAGTAAAAEKKAFLAEKRIRVREQEKAQRRLRYVMEKSSRREGSSGEEEDYSSMLDDFLAAASSEKVLLQERVFSPETSLMNILRYEDYACTEKGITLRFYRDSRLPEAVSGFGSLLCRALCELLENAIRATGKGGIISVHCRADRPAEGLVNIHFRIDDNGVGITPARMQTIFEAEREAGTDQPVHSGLFAAKEAAALMGGSVHARSGPGGSRFRLSVALRTAGLQDQAAGS